MNDNNYELAIALIQRKDVFQVSLPKKRRVGRSATPPTPFPTYLSFFFNATNSRQIHFCVHKSLKKFEQSLLKCSDKDKELRNFTLFSLLGLFYFEYFFFQNALKNSCQGVQARAGWESQHTYIFPKRRYQKASPIGKYPFIYYFRAVMCLIQNTNHLTPRSGRSRRIINRLQTGR